MAHTNVALCTAKDENQAYDIVVALKSAGFQSDDISVLLPNHLSSTEFVHEANTKAPEGASIGAGTGGVVGGILGLLVGMGSLAIPGLGPLIAAGPIFAALSGIAAGGTVGGLAGGLIGMGMTEVEAKLYEGAIQEGQIVITVDCGTANDRVSTAKQVFRDHNAENVTSLSAREANRRTA
ncbi:MAG: hypothetical protein R3F59_02235 [Myxococcota bacterium]